MEEEGTEETVRANKRGAVYPIRVTKHEMPKHVNMLLTEREGVSHYYQRFYIPFLSQDIV